MTFDELNKMTWDISHKVRALRTFTTLFNVAVMEVGSIDDRKEKLPELDDISNVAFMLASQAEDAVEKLVSALPPYIEGITP